LFISIARFRPLLPQEVVDLRVPLLAKLLNDCDLLVGEHRALAYLLSHLHRGRLLLLRFLSLRFLGFPAGFHAANHVLVIVDLALDGLPKDSLVIVHHFVQFFVILVGTHGLLEVILQFKLVKGVGIEIILIKLVEPRASYLPIIDNSRIHIRIVEFSWRLMRYGIIDI
jgi:hypothetical protein